MHWDTLILTFYILICKMMTLPYGIEPLIRAGLRHGVVRGLIVCLVGVMQG